jgi:hypothetical protein
MYTHAVDECLQTPILSPENGAFLALCTDCRLISSNASLLWETTSISYCKDKCQQSGLCIGIEYNQSSGRCLLNFDFTRNMNVEQLPKNSMVEVWALVKMYWQLYHHAIIASKEGR